ncbi:MAG: PGF-pre-PGF domain-containing protein, partial [Candidatus Aenigmatarchaeota archaeon]
NSEESDEDGTGDDTTGGSGGISMPPVTPTQSKSWGSLLPNTSYEMVIDDTEKLGIDKISFTIGNETSDAKIIVKKQEGKPEGISIGIPGHLYRYMDIEVENIGEHDLKEVRIRFSVNRSWITNNSIDKGKIFLNRYVDGEWKKLDTKELSESSDKVMYESTSPGFSYFAVSGEEKTEEESVTKTTTPEKTTTTTVKEEIEVEEEGGLFENPLVLWLFSILIIVLIIALFLFFVK